MVTVKKTGKQQGKIQQKSKGIGQHNRQLIAAYAVPYPKRKATDQHAYGDYGQPRGVFFFQYLDQLRKHGDGGEQARRKAYSSIGYHNNGFQVTG